MKCIVRPPHSAEPKEASKSAASSAADLFELRDVNKDGKVTLAEFLNGRTGPTVPGLEKRFKSYDSDGDGVWTRSELQSASKPKGTNQ